MNQQIKLLLLALALGLGLFSAVANATCDECNAPEGTIPCNPGPPGPEGGSMSEDVIVDDAVASPITPLADASGMKVAAVEQVVPESAKN